MTKAEATGVGTESVHLVTIDWTRGKWANAKGKYSREHVWHLAGGAKLKASDSPALVPKGFQDRTAVNPVDALQLVDGVAAAASPNATHCQCRSVPFEDNREEIRHSGEQG